MKAEPMFQANLKTEFTLLVFKHAKTKLNKAIGNSFTYYKNQKQNYKFNVTKLMP